MTNHSDIEKRAYELYETRGRADGHDWDDWLEAERELSRSERTARSEVASPTPRRGRSEQRQPAAAL